MKRFLVTGGSGTIASAIRPILAHQGHSLRLLDIAPPRADAVGSEEFVRGSLMDLEALVDACSGVDLIVHLGGYPTEDTWENIVETNITGTRTVLEAARIAGVSHLLLASSVHAVGFATAADAASAETVYPRPDTYYGVGKVAAEALGSLYADRFDMSIVSARIANFADRPLGDRGLALWFSAGDMARLVEATLALDRPGHSVVWGVSRNTRSWVRTDAGDRIGYAPLDDAECFASAAAGSPFNSGEDTLLAGNFHLKPLGRPRGLLKPP
jgi:nucleoside-diphosphate-sugar epimerase